MYAEVAEKIYVYEPTQAMLEWCRIALVVDNPEYEKKIRMGLWVGSTPRRFYLYEKTDKYIAIPFGCIHRIHEAFPDMSMRSCIQAQERVNYNNRIKLYEYQKNAVQAILERKNGVLVMPCGAGKTQTGLEVISQIGMKVLWLTHTQDLLNQSMNRAKAVLGVDPKSYGTITGGKIDIGSSITFATVQTASKIDLTPYKNEFGVIVVDECHRAVGTPTKAMQFYKVLSNLSCRYKIGLTATPKRSDGMSRTMFSLIGDVVYEVLRSEVVNTTCPVEVKQIETGYVPNADVILCGDGTINYSGLVEDLTHNEKRFNAVRDEINKHKCMLVLGNRVEYLKRLSDAYTGTSTCLSALGNSKAAKNQRKEALRMLNTGELDTVFATYQLAKEGIDVPNLRYVVFATPEKDEATVTQAAGRVARRSDWKEKGVVIDFVDKFGMLIGWSKRREKIYEKKLGFTIV